MIQIKTIQKMILQREEESPALPELGAVTPVQVLNVLEHLSDLFHQGDALDLAMSLRRHGRKRRMDLIKKRHPETH